MNALDILYITGGVLAAPFVLRKKREGWSERFGRGDSLPARSRPRLLLHAVSVGEVNALRHLVPLLVAGTVQSPAPDDVDLVITAGTDTGLARARELFATRATILRYPLDFSWSVERFLDRVRPDAVALIELEVWPNFIRSCVRRGVPVGVVNGRLSERSFSRYRRARFALRSTFASLRFVAAQDEDYATRFRAMGVAADRVMVTNTMKWDAASVPTRADVLPAGAEELARTLGIDRSRPLIVAGSTGPGEEALLHASCPPGAQLLCAPRKPERFNEAAAAMPGCVRRSMPAGQPSPVKKDRFLLDSIGELRVAYALADVVVVGRSFGDLFGSDPIEPAALSKPVVIGPRFGDFSQSVQTLQAAKAIRVVGREELATTLAELVTDEPLRRSLGLAAREAVIANQGASVRHAALLREMLTARPAGSC